MTPDREQNTPNRLRWSCIFRTFHFERLRWPAKGHPSLFLVSRSWEPPHFLCSIASSVPVRYERRQVEGKGANGRQVPAQFDLLAGDVFRVLRGKVGVTASCFLAGTGRISGATLVPVKTDEGNGACGTAVEGRLTASKWDSVKTVSLFPGCCSLYRT